MSVTELAAEGTFSLNVTPDRDRVVLVLAGDFDLEHVDSVEEVVGELRRVGFDRIVIDLRRVRFIDLAGLRLLLVLRDDAERDGHHFELRPGPSAVQRLFALTRTGHRFQWT